MTRDERVVLVARVDPVLREYARAAARLSGLTLSLWVARAVQRAVKAESAAMARAAARARESNDDA